MFATAAPSEPVELRFGVCESLFGSGSLLLELALAHCEDALGGASIAVGLVDRERFGGAGGQRVDDSLRDPVALGSVAGQVGVERRSREVEAGFSAGARAGDVAPLLQRSPVFDEDEGSVDRRSLGGVTGQGVAVVEVLRRVGDRRPLGALPGRCGA